METHRHSCMSFQSLTIGWLALVQALEEYQERRLAPSSPLAGKPDAQREREREKSRCQHFSDAVSTSSPATKHKQAAQNKLISSLYPKCKLPPCAHLDPSQNLKFSYIRKKKSSLDTLPTIKVLSKL